MSEHTPTPWHFLPGDKKHQAMVMANGEDGLPMVIGGFGMAGSQAVENTANAEFIVRAVNSFDAWMALGQRAGDLMEAVKAGDSVQPLWELVSDMASLYDEAEVRA